MLIRNAEVWGHGRADVRVAGGRIAEMAPPLSLSGDSAIDAAGGALIPGLHDHHIHLAGLAVKAQSIPCGPPEVNDARELASQLNRAGSGWLRGTGYHESVMGLPGARELDAIQSERPLRIQHRSGRMWLLNSMALDELLAVRQAPPGLEREGARYTGRLFDEDDWLRATLGSNPPDLDTISRQLASYGVTGLTDMSPGNGNAIAAHFRAQRQTGSLRQSLHVAGRLSLTPDSEATWHIGPAKLHLHEAALPDFEEAVRFLQAAHQQDRSIAIHCVTQVELVFAIALLEQAGSVAGDRIEHASVASPDLVERIAGLSLHVCVQPHFIRERGDQYLRDVEPQYQPDLYRLQSLSKAGIPLSGGSDAPFGSPDPWSAMAAAVSRRTCNGQSIGAEEALTPEQALELYHADPSDLSRRRAIQVGSPADLCLLNAPWSQARLNLNSGLVRTTLISGRVVHDLVDQPPGERMPS